MSYGFARGLHHEAPGSSVVRYKVQADRTDENVALVGAVYAQLADERPEGIHYATLRLPDGELAAFKAFVDDIESRCDEPPVATGVTLVGTYGVGL